MRDVSQKEVRTLLGTVLQYLRHPDVEAIDFAVPVSNVSRAVEQMLSDMPAKVVEIHGRRWFSRSQGNTYFSAVATVDGEKALEIDYAYGYGQQYVESTYQALIDAGHLPPRVDREPVWTHARDNNIRLEYSAIDVTRKKDL